MLPDAVKEKEILFHSIDKYFFKYKFSSLNISVTNSLDSEVSLSEKT